VSICWFCYRSLCIEKSFWNPYYKNCPVIWQYFVTCYADFNSFSKSMVGAFQTNISRRICITPSVKAVELKKRKTHKDFLRIWDGIRKLTPLSYFC